MAGPAQECGKGRQNAGAIRDVFESLQMALNLFIFLDSVRDLRLTSVERVCRFSNVIRSDARLVSQELCNQCRSDAESQRSHRDGEESVRNWDSVRRKWMKMVERRRWGVYVHI